MTEPYIGEIRILPYTYAPRSWTYCEGQLLPIRQYNAVFSILETIYGGDGMTTFAVPNLAARAPMQHGNGPGLTPRRIGQSVGVPSVSLSERQMPQHRHAARVADAQADESTPAGHYLANAGMPARGGRFHAQPMYAPPGAANGMMASEAVGTTGDGQAHENRQPYLAINFCICLDGIFPSRN